MSNDDPCNSDSLPENEKGAIHSHSSVGYGRPPTRSQFKSGQSGNPRGRPKRPSIDLSVYLSDMLDEQSLLSARRTGRRRSNQLIFVQSLMDRVLSGDGKALAPLMRLLSKANEFKIPPPPKDEYGVVVAPPEYNRDRSAGTHIGKLYYGTNHDGVKVPFRIHEDDYPVSYHGPRR